MRRRQSVLRGAGSGWALAVAGSLVALLFGVVMGLLELRVSALEDDVRTNRMVRMAPETRSELNALSGRVERLERDRETR